MGCQFFESCGAGVHRDSQGFTDPANLLQCGPLSAAPRSHPSLPAAAVQQFLPSFKYIIPEALSPQLMDSTLATVGLS